MKLTKEQVDAHQRKFPISGAVLNRAAVLAATRPVCPSPGSEVPNAQPEPKPGRALVETPPGEAKGVQRLVVRFVGYRVRPLDPDNFAGSVKDLLDGLRHAGLIPGDESWRIKLETEQERVGHFADEKTVVEITIPIPKG